MLTSGWPPAWLVVGVTSKLSKPGSTCSYSACAAPAPKIASTRSAITEATRTAALDLGFKIPPSLTSTIPVPHVSVIPPMPPLGAVPLALLLPLAGGLLRRGLDVSGAAEMAGAVDRRRRRRGTVRAVALVRGFTRQQFRFFREPAAGAGVIELHVFAVVVALDERLVGREVDIDPAVAGRFEPDVGADGQ